MNGVLTRLLWASFIVVISFIQLKKLYKEHYRRNYYKEYASKNKEKIPILIENLDYKKYTAESSHRNNEKNYWIASIIISCIALGGAIISVFFANRALISSNDQVIAAREQIFLIRKEQRTWISPYSLAEIEGSSLKAAPPLTLAVAYENVGHEPALEVQTRSQVGTTLLSGLQKGHQLWAKNISCDGNVVDDIQGVSFPGHSATADVAIIPVPDTLIVADKDEIMKGTRIMFVEGCITYRTMSEPHHSLFCFYLRPVPTVKPEKWTVAKCPRGNDAD